MINMAKFTKTFFILPGFKMQATDQSFRWLITFLEQSRVKVIKVPIQWNYKTLSENATEFIEFFNKNKGKQNYVLGFSYGAVITFLTANSIRPKKIFLCSLSPDFREDQSSMKAQSIRYIGKKRHQDTKTRSVRKIARDLEVPSIVLYGQKEGRQYPSLKKRCEEVVRLAKHSQLIVIKDSPHKIDFPEYVIQLKKVLREVII